MMPLCKSLSHNEREKSISFSVSYLLRIRPNPSKFVIQEFSPFFRMVTFLLCQSPINILSFKETSLARMTSYFCPYSHIHILSYNFGLLVCFFLFLQQKPQRRASSEILIRTKRKVGRFYEEYEYERRLKKRRAKLITATEEAFAHIKRMPGDHMKGKSTFSPKK